MNEGARNLELWTNGGKKQENTDGVMWLEPLRICTVFRLYGRDRR